MSPKPPGRRGLGQMSLVCGEGSGLAAWDSRSRGGEQGPANGMLHLQLAQQRGQACKEAQMQFGVNFFPSFLPEQKSGSQYFAECLNLCELADRLGFASIRIV